MTRVAMVAEDVPAEEGRRRPLRSASARGPREARRLFLRAYHEGSGPRSARRLDQGRRGWLGPADPPALVRGIREAVRGGAKVVHVQHATGTYGFKRVVFFLPPLLRAAAERHEEVYERVLKDREKGRLASWRL